MLRPLAVASWREGPPAQRGLADPVGASPATRLAGRPRPYDAFAVRCHARDRERQAGTGYGFGIFIGARRRDQPQRRAARSATRTCVDWIDEACAGRGYMPESVVVLDRWLPFDDLRLRLQVNIIPRNATAAG